MIIGGRTDGGGFTPNAEIVDVAAGTTCRTFGFDTQLASYGAVGAFRTGGQGRNWFLNRGWDGYKITAKYVIATYSNVHLHIFPYR